MFQAIAWAQMIRDYSKTATIAEAIAKTFKGRSPCGMCKKISAERQREGSAPAMVKVEKKGEIFLVSISPCSPRPDDRDYSYFDNNPSTPATLPHAPPAPVPRNS